MYFIGKKIDLINFHSFDSCLYCFILKLELAQHFTDEHLGTLIFLWEEMIVMMVDTEIGCSTEGANLIAFDA